MTARRLRIGIDTGGTFTDVVAIDERSGQLVTTKTPSTPSDPAEGFVAAVHKVLTMLDAGPDEISAVSHGTTVATNRLLEGRIGPLGFITTEGYEFLLEIARQSVPDGYGNSYFWIKPDRIVPAELVRTVRGRLDHTGAQLRPLDEVDAVEAARFFRARGIDTIGICLLHSYADPSHELRVRDIILREHPGAIVSISSDVLREYREYERAMTTLVDAAVKPAVSRYVAAIRQRLDALADGLPCYVMKSNGGVLSASEVVHHPITTMLSGPAAGALGAALIGQRAGFDRVLTLDGGGTSTDVCVVIDGEPSLTTEGSVGGYPSKIPMIDIVTVGAGGGSIATVSADGALRVGPQSAGAEPGPVCYGLGGSDVTVTDAHVVLGRVPARLLGGEIALDVEAARASLATLATRLGLSIEACANGILEISAWNQANALRQITVKRGLDVRDFTLTTFGGSGSLLLCRLMDILDMQTVLVPQHPGNVSAFGLLTVDVKNDYVRTATARHDRLDVERVEAILAELAGEAAKALVGDELRFVRSADLRYFGQAYEIRVPLADGPLEPDAVATAFHEAHRALYGYDFAHDGRQQVEWVNLRVTGVLPIARPAAQRLAPPPAVPAGPTVRRPVCFDGRDFVEAAVFDRAALGAGAIVEGPAIIEEYGSTVPLHPGFRARVDEFGNLIVTRSSDGVTR